MFHNRVLCPYLPPVKLRTVLVNSKGRMIETSLTLDVVYIAQKCKLDLSWYDRSKSNFRKIPVLD